VGVVEQTKGGNGRQSSAKKEKKVEFKKWMSTKEQALPS